MQRSEGVHRSLRKAVFLLLGSACLVGLALAFVPLATSSATKAGAGTPITVMSISPVNSSFSTFRRSLRWRRFMNRASMLAVGSTAIPLRSLPATIGTSRRS